MVVAPRITPNLDAGSYSLICLARVALPAAYAPASIAPRVIGARRLPLHDKVVVLEEATVLYRTELNMEK
jgi:hypothetical protein